MDIYAIIFNYLIKVINVNIFERAILYSVTNSDFQCYGENKFPGFAYVHSSGLKLESVYLRSLAFIW